MCISVSRIKRRRQHLFSSNMVRLSAHMSLSYKTKIFSESSPFGSHTIIIITILWHNENIKFSNEYNRFCVLFTFLRSSSFSFHSTLCNAISFHLIVEIQDARQYTKNEEREKTKRKKLQHKWIFWPFILWQVNIWWPLHDHCTIPHSMLLYY